MKKIKYFIILNLFFFLSIININAANKLNSLDIDIKIDENGIGHVTEIWNMKTKEDTEIYKEEYSLGNMKITNFKVSDEDRKYSLNDPWDIDENFTQKKYKYGINYVDEGIELCWGISEYGTKKYTITYDIENLVFNTSDSQIFYRRVVNDLEFPPERFSLTLTGPTSFSDTLDVWGYGYKGYAYVKDGKVFMSNEENTELSNGDYAVLLIKFPLNTFNVDENNSYSQFEKFDDVLNSAQEGTFDYDYGNIGNIFSIIGKIFSTLFPIFIVIITMLLSSGISKYKFGKAGSKINMKEINNYRDIPCDKNIFRAYFLAQAYKLNKRNTDFLGSIFLKWLSEDKIEIKKDTKSTIITSKTEYSIILKENMKFDNEVEQKLYSILIDASKDYILESKELEKWCKSNYSKFFKWFEKAEDYGRDLYVNEGKVTKESIKYLIQDDLKEEAIKLAGLKKFLLEFSRIQEKEAIEVKLWKEYLMYAQIFGIADKVAEQFKKLYPEIVTDLNNSNFDMTDILIINHLSRSSVVSATSARSAAQSYSGGGGGFSSGGGGGGSFGGGGGGSR